MKKFIFGLIVGLMIAIPVGANASAVDNLIGRLVEGVFPVKVNGTQIEKQAIVIEGTSYLPVRAIGDALGMDVKFNADLGIELNQKPKAAMMTVTDTTYTPAPTKQEQIDKLNRDIASAKSEIGMDKGIIDVANWQLKNKPNPTDDFIKSVNDTINANNDAITKAQTRLADLETQLAQLQTP